MAHWGVFDFGPSSLFILHISYGLIYLVIVIFVIYYVCICDC